MFYRIFLLSKWVGNLGLTSSDFLPYVISISSGEIQSPMPEYSTWRNFAGQGSSTQGRAAIQLPTVKVTENPTKVTERTVKRGTFQSCISRPDSVGKNTTENTCRDASFIQLGSFSVVICATVFRNFQFN